MSDSSSSPGKRDLSVHRGSQENVTFWDFFFLSRCAIYQMAPLPKKLMSARPRTTPDIRVVIMQVRANERYACQSSVKQML